jgi:hypothetical protein
MRMVRRLVFALEDPVCAALWSVVLASLTVLAG